MEEEIIDEKVKYVLVCKQKKSLDNDEIMETNLQKLHVQKWYGGQISLCWNFYCVNDNKEVGCGFFKSCVVSYVTIVCLMH